MQMNLHVHRVRLAGAGRLLKRALPVAGLLTAASLLLAGLALTLLEPEPGGPPDGRTQRLSSYLIDTEFLLLSARQHRAALAASDLLSPEIRLAVLQMSAAAAPGE